MTELWLATLGSELVIAAEVRGWSLRPTPGAPCNLGDRDGWPSEVMGSPQGRRAIAEAGQLLDMEIAEIDGTGLLIPWPKFGLVLSESFGIPLRGSVPSPLMLRIDSTSQVSRADFTYRYDYLLGARETAVERVGYFVRRQATGTVYCLDERTYRIVAAMDEFNALPAAEKSGRESWLALATVKSVAREVGASLDKALASNDVVMPAQLVLGMCAHDDGSLSFYPVCDGLPEEDFKAAFFRNAGVEDLYTIDAADGGRVRVLLDERQKVVLQRMKSAQRLKGAARQDALHHPEKFFDGVLDAVVIYGERVIGIGDLPGSVMPSNPNPGGGFFVKDHDLTDTGPGGGSGQEEPASEGHPSELPLDGIADLEGLRDAVARAQAEGKDEVEWAGAVLEITPALIAAIERAIKQSEGQSREPCAQGRKYLLVYTNEDELRAKDVEDAEFAAQPASAPTVPTLPDSLVQGIELKAHQTEAISWLERCSSLRPHRRGALLADEMGLGKTLEVLTFLAKFIEAGGLKCDLPSMDGMERFRPILIVVPLMLLENGTWQAEMRRFFKHDGVVFMPALSLHGAGVDRVRAVGVQGSETVIGRPVLDASRLMQHRVIVTNYETVVNYQHSLAQLYDGKRSMWSVVVTDEAQKQKAPDTKVSAALKAISADFKIAMTGTPVENRLLDLWNIVDYFQPALLGTKRDFCATYEQPAIGPGAAEALEALRARLLYRTPHTYLLRRTTAAVVKDLPSRTIHEIPCEMSDEERVAHLSLLSVLDGERKKGRHLQVLQRLVRLYQHPALDREENERDDPKRLLKQSSKLRAVVALLTKIKARGEKAIIFARYVDAQQILSLVVADAFGIRVPIINGSTSRSEAVSGSSAGTERARSSRKAILDEFQRQPGFGVVILSPFVAGIGLTIVEANHVIHYGRWWNPAVEGQATARVYRIGQTRPVHVYLPMLVDPKKQLAKTFDELLHELMLRKEALAHDFLAPVPAEDECARELCDDLLKGGAGAGANGQAFTAQQLAALDPADFEAAVAALLRAEGHQVVLTARSNDGGADVIAVRAGRATLVQAKHSTVGNPPDEGALNDVIGAADIYGPRLGLGGISLLVVSNAPAAPQTKSAAASHGIELLCGDALVKRMQKAGVGLGAMVACASTRCRNFEEGLKRALEAKQEAGGNDKRPLV